MQIAEYWNISKSSWLGRMDDEDIDLIIDTVISSPQEKRIRLKRFGLI